MKRTVIALSFLALLSAYGIAHAEDAASGATAVPVATPAPAPTANVTAAPAENVMVKPAAVPLTPEQKAMQDKGKAAESASAGDPADVAALKVKANSGDAAAQHELGVMYGEGQGDVERNYKEALKWHRMAAENADPDSQHYMGFSCENGIGGETRSDVNAAEWYLKAAEQGHAVSEGIIGNMYANGKGVDQDYQKAYVWLSIAKRNGDEYYAGQIDSVKKHIPGKYWKRVEASIDNWRPVKGEKALSSGTTINFGN